MADPINVEDARRALARGIRNFETYVADGRIEIIDGRGWYLADGKFDPKKITDGWNTKVLKARAKGFAGLRISGNAFWHGTHHWNDFLDYERDVHRTFTGQRVIAMCTYSLAESQASDVLDVARTHNVTVALRKGTWEVIESSWAVAKSNAACRARGADGGRPRQVRSPDR